MESDTEEMDDVDRDGRLMQAWREAFESMETPTEYCDNTDQVGQHQQHTPAADPPVEPAQPPLRRSGRERTLNPRYYNNDLVTNCVGYGDDVS